MKRFSKLLSVLLAVALLACLAIPAMAEEQASCTITIENAQNNATYYAYKLLDVTYSGDGAYTYYMMKTTEQDDKVAKWNNFLANSNCLTITPIDQENIVTWVSGQDVQTFADNARQYAEDHSIDADATATATGSTVSMTIASDGYYLVTSSTGSVAFVHTAAPNVTITEKNEAPTLDLKVLELAEDNDSLDAGTWLDFNRVEAGETIHYKIEVPVKTGAINYVIHDEMDAHHHLSLKVGSTKVYIKAGDTVLVDPTNYTITRYDANDNKVDPTSGSTPVCRFEVAFTEEFLDEHDDTGEEILIVTFEANFVGTVDAVKDSPHENRAWLSYGADTSNPAKTVTATVNTASYALDLLKYAGENFNKPLAGAQFRIFRTKSTDSTNTDTYGGPVHFHLVQEYAETVTSGDTDKSTEGNIYTVCNASHADGVNDNIDYITTPANGTCLIYGLDTETYYVEEIKAPDGYNPLNAPVTVTLDVNHMSSVRVYDLNISNNSGSILPDTGGIGTTIFYILGGVMVLGAAVLLITKKRMGAED